ncbi:MULTISPECIES: quinone oxidoreductase family protein [Thioclava]|uniref:quinone oxidoreductase family protein n=1 Tax=Thioclava TaxID=285107 RepID=UPI000B53E746|nr:MULTISPECIES: quinone oxidoreductase [Thioclava]OWY18452.1 quinone oxidoreductase [Thioclava sp. JM3]WGT50145.1 quinone oxidoreductase [Thioclava nitratireducens]
MAYAMAIARPGGRDQFHKIEIEVPKPGPGEITLRHTAIGLNFIDVYFRTGLYPWPVESDLITGGEAAGVIEAVGNGVDLQVGQRVAYTQPNGAYASHRVIAAKNVVPIPDDISDEVAAAVMLKGLTVHYLIHHSYPVKSGDTVLFHAAAGGVGSIAGQWLKAKGVRAIGTAGGPEKCARALEHGYDAVIDYRTEDFGAEVKRLTDGAGVAAVYDSVGADTVMTSLDVLKRFGTLVCFGQSSGPADQFKIGDLARNSLFLTRPTLFQHTDQPGWLRNSAAELFEMIGKGDIKIDVPQTFSLEDVAAAHEALEGRKTVGSTVLTP